MAVLDACDPLPKMELPCHVEGAVGHGTPRGDQNEWRTVVWSQ